MDIIAILIGFLGMLLIIQPWKPEYYKTFNLQIKTDERTGLQEIFGQCLAFIAAICGALVVTYSRRISQNVHNSIIGYYYALGTLLFSPIQVMLLQRKDYPEYGWNLIGLVMAIGILSFSFLSLMTYSQKYISAAASATIIYLGIPFNYLLDYICYGTQAGGLEITGAALIVVINMIIGFLKGSGVIK